MNGRRRFLTASVISIQDSSFVYPSCQNCFSRLHLDLERYNCLKCGCSGDARKANYRYRLSLQVTDTHEVFLVTVFGSCLEAFFGVTAESLQRYIDDLNLGVGEAAREASPSVVIQAVETCFIGKKFIFGVKDSEKQDGASCLQNGSRVGHHPKALTACQMFIPNPGLVGCTVLHYLHQQQFPSGSGGSHGGRWSPGHLFTALDLPSSGLSSVHGSGDWDMVSSGHTQSLSSLWPQSFELTSLSISGGTAVDSADFHLSRIAYDEQKWDNHADPLQRHNQSINNSQDNNSTVNERNVQEGDKFCLHSTWRGSIFVTEDAQSHSSERDGHRSLWNPLEAGMEDSPGKISIQHSHCLEKSQNPLQGSASPLISGAGHPRDGRSSQGDPWFWDELPSSESLDEFIARIENSNAMGSPTETRAQGRFPSKGTGESHGRVNQSLLQLDAASTTSQAQEKLQEVAENTDAFKTDVPSRHCSNRLSGKEYQQEASFRSLSTQGKVGWEHLSTHLPILLPQLSPIGIQPSGLKGSCLLSKERVDQDVIDHKNGCASSPLKAASNYLESPAHLNCKCEDDATGWRKKVSSCCEPKQTACAKRDSVCEGQPLPELHENHYKGGDISILLRDSSISPQGSYNASADLFDFSTAGAETMVGLLSTTQRGPLTTRSVASGRKPRQSEASWNTFQSGLSFLDRFAAPDLKASPPVAHSAVELEYSPSGTQDFVPSSQSTPCRQARLPRGKESVLSKLPLNKLPWTDAQWKEPRPVLKGPLVKRLLSKFLQSRRSSDASSGATDTSIARGLLINGRPARELSENGGEEWVPPSEKKQRQPLHFQKQKTFGSRRRRRWDFVERTPFSETQTGQAIPRGTVGLARTEFAPKSQQPTEATVGEDTAGAEQGMGASPKFHTFPKGSRSNLSSTPMPVNWSPELF